LIFVEKNQVFSQKLIDNFLKKLTDTFQKRKHFQFFALLKALLIGNVSSFVHPNLKSKYHEKQR